MSSCAASSCICSPRALFASATSASWPTEGAPPCCHRASPLFTPLHRKTNRKRRPLLQRTRCGAVPSAVDRWPSSNDSQPHNSNSVLHRSRLRLHEITRPQPQLLPRFSALRRSVSPSPLDTFFMPQSRFRFKRHFALPMRVNSSAGDLDHPDNFYKPLLLHSICISTASAAPAASF